MGEDQHISIEPIDERSQAHRLGEEEGHKFSVHEGFMGDPDAEFLGFSYSAIPIVVQSESHEQAREKVTAAYSAVLDALKHVEGVEVPDSVLIQYGCFTQAAAITKDFIAKETAKQ